MKSVFGWKGKARVARERRKAKDKEMQSPGYNILMTWKENLETWLYLDQTLRGSEMKIWLLYIYMLVYADADAD